MRNKNSSERRRKVNFGGIELKVCMTKVRKFAEITPNLPFSDRATASKNLLPFA